MQKIELPKEGRSQVIGNIRRYFLSERDEEIGDLSAELLLDFIIDELGPVFYNQGIRDACSFMSDKVEDMYGLEKKPRF